MLSKLQALKTMTVVVADTGDIEAVRRLRPQDCTTNPTLILKTIEQSSSAAHLIQDAVAVERDKTRSRDPLIAAVGDRLAVAIGVALTRLVPGRVSTEVDADLSFNTDATIDKARLMIAAYEAAGVSRSRVLVKIAATWEGIQAVRALQAEGIDCNVTLVFSTVQAVAAAQAGAFLISPFVGRILDWHLAQGRGPFTPETDPGVTSVRTIYETLKAHGFKTVVMGASFRSREQIEALAGCDRLTISPVLLDALDAEEGLLPRRLRADTVSTSKTVWPLLDEDAFHAHLSRDRMATEKLEEGIRLFSADLAALRATIGAWLDSSARDASA